jgi:hypothetical protein
MAMSPGPPSRPAMRRNRLDFPAAFGPITAVTSPPFRTGVVMPDRTGRLPYCTPTSLS